MRLLYITPRYPPHLGGTEIHTFEVALAMAARGHEVGVITTDRQKTLPIAESKPGLEVIRVPAYPKGHDYYFAPSLRRYVRHEKPDLVHVQSCHTAVAPLTMHWLANRGTPHLLSFHSGGSSKPWRRSVRPIQHRILRRFTGETRAMVAVSEFERELFMRRLHTPRSSIDVIRNGVSHAILDQVDTVDRDPNLIVTAGRLEQYKGHHLVIGAMPTIQRSRPEARLLVVGSGPYEPELRRQAQELGLGDTIGFTSVSQDDRSEMGRLLAGATVSTMLSDYEAEGIGAIESRAMGCRTVVTAATALAELIDDDTVFGLEPGASTQAIANRLIDALEAGPTTTDIVPRTWGDVADDLESLYHRLVG